MANSRRAKTHSITLPSAPPMPNATKLASLLAATTKMVQAWEGALLSGRAYTPLDKHYERDDAPPVTRKREDAKQLLGAWLSLVGQAWMVMNELIPMNMGPTETRKSACEGGPHYLELQAISCAAQWVIDRQGMGMQDAIEMDRSGSDRLNLLRHAVEQLRAKCHHANGAGEQSPTSPATPKKYLTSWREILTTLDLPNNAANQRKVKGLQDKYGGPIILPTQGGQPTVEQRDLLTWYDKIHLILKSEKDQADGRHAAANQQYQHGRDATVAPEMSGHVKKRKKGSH